LQAKLRGTVHWTVDQGVEMGRPSRLEVEADLSDGKVIAIRVSGSSVLVSHGVMEIPEGMSRIGNLCRVEGEPTLVSIFVTV